MAIRGAAGDVRPDGTVSDLCPDPGISLSSPDLFREPGHDSLFAELRAKEGLTWCTPEDGSKPFWSVTRYADIAAAYADSEGLSSEAGAVGRGSFHSEVDSAAGKMLVASDPPIHSELRAAMRPAFAPTAVRDIGELIRTGLEQRWQQAADDGGCDFARDVAPELPRAALRVLFDIDEEQADHLLGLTARVIGFRDDSVLGLHPAAGIQDEAIRLALLQGELMEFFINLVDRYRRAPSPCPAASYVNPVEGQPDLSDELVIYNLMNLAIGGNETTQHTASHGLLALLSRSVSYDRLRNPATDADHVSREMIRWASVNAYVSRIATRDLVVGGTSISAGDTVFLWNYSGNRDPEKFSEADTFSLDRAVTGHLSFGTGIHRCIGQMLGTVELRVLVESLRNLPFRLRAGGAETYLRSNFIRGVTSCPVEVAAD